jgi:hypothetical protein
MYPAFVLNTPGLLQSAPMALAIYNGLASDSSSPVKDASPWRMPYLYPKRNEASMRTLTLA